MERTSGFEIVRAAALATPWPTLESSSGTSEAAMRRFAQLLVSRPDAVLVWSMGLTQHAHGVETVQALVNLGLARGLVGKRNRGLMPIRGHSGVQGGAEVGCVPGMDAATRETWTRAWGVPPPESPGLTAAGMIDASAAGAVDLFWIVGGNFLDTLADPARTRQALARPALRVHQDIVVTSAMLEDPSDTVLLLPATTRYESPGGGTETTTERRIVFSPEIPGRRIGEARPEWTVFRDVFVRAFPGRARLMDFPDAAAIRSEIAGAVPLYAGIERLSVKGDQVQWGSRVLFEDGVFATSDGRARFVPVTVPVRPRPPGRFRVSTRRGKQFNSMIQRSVDPLTGAAREAVLMSPVDAARLGLSQGSAVRLRSPFGEFAGRVHVSAMHPGNLAVHWPEGNVLLSADARDPSSHEPDFNVDVEVGAVPEPD